MSEAKKYDAKEQIRQLKAMEAYEYIDEEEIPEIAATGVRFVHKKSGANLFLLLCDDDNKVFTVGFRTPCADSTGVPHIIEHTVLCGSEKFPSKDPFVELVKGSLNTFLNAMTFPDKTLYPVASLNDKDFANLMDVYMDAVLHPNIYREEKIFKQEGWHYEMSDRNSPLTINGVVYNEMKGVYSDVNGQMEHDVMKTLFPDHPYSHESGGDPQVIPKLTYEDYLDFHRKYYHPSNSYIYLYGAMDMAEKLAWLDDKYLSFYGRMDIDSSIAQALPLKAPVQKSYSYSISDTENEDRAVYLTMNTIIGCELDPVRYTGFQILDYVLLSVPGAPIHDALIDAGIGDDVYGGYNYGLSTPYFSFIAKNTRADQEAEFKAVIRGTLTRLVNNGIDRDMLYAAINVMEFKAREADFGSSPKGLIYGMEAFNSWLYDADPYMHLKFKDTFDILKKKVSEGFFESLIKDYLLDSENYAMISFVPQKGLTAQKDEKLRVELENIRSGFDEEEINDIVRQTAELKAYQSEPSSREDLLKIPMLKREDIGRNAEPPIWNKKSIENISLIISPVFTSGIAYIRLVFDADRIPDEDIPYLALLKDIFGYIDTEKHSYGELSTLINLHSGGIDFSLDSYPVFKEKNISKYTFSANAKVLYDNMDFALDTSLEILLGSKLSDTKRLRDIIAETMADTKEKLTSAGHNFALLHATAAFSREALFGDMTKGISYYKFLEELCEDIDSKLNALSAKLKYVAGRLIDKNNLLIDITCEPGACEDFEKAAAKWVQKIGKTYKQEQADFECLPNVKTGCMLEKSSGQILTKPGNEAFSCASQVNYVALAGNFIKHGYTYSGVLRILKVLLNYDYMWNAIRVRGGAYGCMSAFGRNGDAGFVSYRDPNIAQTEKVYEGIAKYAESFDADEREMTKYIIGAISGLDIPRTPYTKGLLGLSAYISGVTSEDMQKEREEILSAQPQDIRALAPLLEAVLNDSNGCVIGNDQIIRRDCKNYTISPLYTA